MSDRKCRNRFKLLSCAGLDKLRFCVNRSCKHVSAQIIDRAGNVLADVTSSKKTCPVYNSSKIEKAKWVGSEIAKKIDLNLSFYFDRGKYAYHGVVKNLAESARESGMRF
ncbi:50S ribosomal protein L18 [Alphaproteobacteria bacterium endosymbiont of Tiliacea citrago]|uniref:50S ribosomal protein L18 n=1 Tax=Alphaproteobacteria bacterium endosymbiont of Tiliacea citrago TaxID=3077944 RepID=UPI00313DDE21